MGQTEIIANQIDHRRSMYSLVSGYMMRDTRANILAATPTIKQLAYATDTGEFLFYDGTGWYAFSIEPSAENSTPDMGAYNPTGLGISDKAGYYHEAITDKDITNSRILGNEREEEGAVRTTTGGTFQVYLNGVWNDVVINFVMREDSDGTYELEHAPIGYTYYYEVMSGNSDELGLDGKPIFQQYVTSMGCYQPDVQIDGGSFG